MYRRATSLFSLFTPRHLSVATVLAISSVNLSAQPIDKSRDLRRWPVLPPTLATTPAQEQRIDSLLASLSIEQKVAQIIQPEIRDITVDDMRQYGFGSYLNGGGSFPKNNKHATMADWRQLAYDMWAASVDDRVDGTAIPTMWGTDAVHGHNNVIGATLFPHNIGLGAAHNPDLIRQIGQATAEQVQLTGIDWIFAPTVAVVRDDRWGRSYEGYAEDPTIVAQYAAALVEGIQYTQENRSQVLATAKHFIGDGGTQYGDDQGDNLSSEAELVKTHAPGYFASLKAGTYTIMASFSQWQGDKVHGSHYLLTKVLKERLNFNGLVVGDWNGHGQIPGCSNERCAQAVNAGIDVLMAPTPSWKPLFHNTVEQVKQGEISQVRLDDAVRRVLRVKLLSGILDNQPVVATTESIDNPEHRRIARQAVRESLVMLKNNHQLLPLSPKQRIWVTGDAADDIGQQSGGWSISWQGTGNKNSDFPGATSIYGGLKAQVEQAGGDISLHTPQEVMAASYALNTEEKPDVAIVVFGETPYAEGNGDIGNLNYQRGNKRDLNLLKRLRQANIPVVSIFITGRPLWTNPEINASDAFVVAWLPGTEGAGVADVILRDANDNMQFDMTGRLSFSWPNTPDDIINKGDKQGVPLFAYSDGFSYQDRLANLPNTLSETLSANADTAPVINLLASPWYIGVSDGDAQWRVSSNVHTWGDIGYRTMDRLIQDDARQISFSQDQSVQLSIADNFPTDLRNYYANSASAKGALTLMARVNTQDNQALQGELSLGIRCVEGCKQSINLTETLSQSMGNWVPMNVSLACFSNSMEHIAKVFAPFQLTYTPNNKAQKTQVNVQLSAIRLDAQAMADIHCQ